MYKHSLFWLAAGFFALALNSSVAAQPLPPAPQVPAKAWLLVEYHSGQVLAARNAETPLPPASLTKLAVAYVLFQHLRDGTLKLTDNIHVSVHAADAKGARMFLQAGETISVEELIKGLLVVSANDAAVALAEHVAGNEAAFVAKMNAAVRALGLQHTTFITVNGLPATGHVSTAHDLARLAAALLHDFPEHYAWFSIKDFTHHGIRQYNRNALLWRDPSVDGFKTGQTHEAGFCLIASARRAEQRLIAVVLGAADENARVIAAQQLLDHGFRYYETRRLYSARTAVTKIRVLMGNASTLALGPAEDLYLTLPRGWHERVRARLTVKQEQVAPVRAGEAIGALAIDVDEEPIAEYPLVALDDVPEGNVFQRAADQVRLWFR